MAKLRKFERQLGEQWPPEAWQDLSVLLAVSGGADSVALLRAVLRLKLTVSGQIAVAHFNHGLRSGESDADETFVVELCRAWDVPCHVGHANVRSLSEQQGDGLESAARSARYDFLEAAARRIGARYVVTAHTADDQVETILHRILRGTGLAGLAGIPRTRRLASDVTLIRPMLSSRRGEVLEYLTEIGQAYRHDASNECLDLTRNRIRHQLLPLLAEQFNSGIADAVLRLGGLAGEAQEIIARLVADLERDCIVEDTARGIRLDCERLGQADGYLVRELLMLVWRQRQWPLQAMGLQRWQDLAIFATAATDGKRDFPGGVVAEKKDGRLTLARL
jgi:tRNA(Ile)-lysidine synthase